MSTSASSMIAEEDAPISISLASMIECRSPHSSSQYRMTSFFQYVLLSVTNCGQELSKFVPDGLIPDAQELDEPRRSSLRRAHAGSGLPIPP